MDGPHHWSALCSSAYRFEVLLHCIHAGLATIICCRVGAGLSRLLYAYDGTGASNNRSLVVPLSTVDSGVPPWFWSFISSSSKWTAVNQTIMGGGILLFQYGAHKPFDCCTVLSSLWTCNTLTTDLSKTRSAAWSWAGTGVSSLTLSVLPQSFPQSCRVLGVRGRTKHFKFLSFFPVMFAQMCFFVTFYKVPPRNSCEKKSKSAVFVMLKIEPWKTFLNFHLFWDMHQFNLIFLNYHGVKIQK